MPRITFLIFCPLALIAARCFREPRAVLPQLAFDAEVLRVREALAAIKDNRIDEVFALLQSADEV